MSNSVIEVVSWEVEDGKSENNSVKFFKFEFLFRPLSDELKERCSLYMVPYRPCLVATDENLVKEYMESEKLEEPPFVRGFVFNDLEFIFPTDEDSSVFRYLEYIEDNEITRSTLSLLKKFCSDNPPDEENRRFTLTSGIIRSLLTLHFWWD